MRYVVIGLGAIGGTVAARLSLTGLDVYGVARGAHLEAMRSDGLLLRTPDGDERTHLSVGTIDDYEHADGDVVVLAVKSQDTEALLTDLAGRVPSTTPIVCAQNGVSNEPTALRWFSRVYGMVVQCPAVHLKPGVVEAYSSPTPGVFDLGRYPYGEDDVSRAIAADWEKAGIASVSVPDIDSYKQAKLLANLANAIEVVCGDDPESDVLAEAARDEARALMTRHGIDVKPPDEERERPRRYFNIGTIDGPRPGSSMWQSVTRGQPVEADHLNGEIVRLARLLGEDAPVNRTLQEWARDVSLGRREFGTTPPAEVLARARDAGE